MGLHGWLLLGIACAGGTTGPSDLRDAADAPSLDLGSEATADVPFEVEWPDRTPLVNPFIGTQGDGNALPGPLVPRGMVKVGPDTASGVGTIESYEWNDDRIEGFSHTHLEGPGGSNNGYSQVLVTATTGPFSPEPTAWVSRYAHDREEARLGYYRVDLLDFDVQAELTAGLKCAVHRYRFDKAGSARVLVDTAHNRGESLEGRVVLKGPDGAEGTGRYQVNPLIAIGLADTNPGTGEMTVHFAIRASRPYDPENSGVFPIGAGAQGARLEYQVEAGEVVEVRVGISYRSVEQAWANLEEGCSGTFEEVREAAVREWNRHLGRIDVTGGTEAERRVFYTALYRTWFQPADITEGGAFFSGWDGVGREVPADGWRYLSDDWCGWDTGRVTHPLHALVDPASRSDVVRSFLQSYRDGGFMAKATWNALGDSRCMTGNFQFCAVADAFVKGFREGYDAAEVFAALRKGSLEDSENALQDGLCGYLGQGTPPDYVDRGYVSIECDSLQGASMTLEHAQNDACVAHFAQAAGFDADAAFFQERSGNWRHVFDASTGFFRPRHRDGRWQDPFDPTAYDQGFTEASAWIYLWSVPHDVCGLVDILGGARAFEDRLDAFFVQGLFDITNEPDYHAPYLYAYVGRAATTQRLVRDLLARHFPDDPGGLPGNDDAGATSAWVVFSMLGLYPVMPSGEGYVIGSPVFPRAVVHLDPDRPGTRDLVIEASGTAPDHPYVQSATWNDVPLDRPFLTWEQVRLGGVLHLEMGPEASSWGSALCPPGS
ncbi:MAG TPA: GH92 family glycosyl hydrolase [Myxococcota bacterium]|nr:GH92 family glycosyl hydrolase [Myxococcota bacterium]